MSNKPFDLSNEEFAASHQRSSPDGKDASVELREPVVRLNAIVDSSGEAILSTDREGLIVTWNEEARRLFGYAAEEIIGLSNLLLIPPAYHDEIRKVQDGILRAGRIDTLQSQMLLKGGGRIDVAITMFPIRNTDGSIVGLISRAHDVHTEQEIEDARLRLIAIVDSSNDAIISKDLNGMVTTWNAAAERMFGYSSQEIVGHSIMTVVPPELQQEQLDVMRRILNGEAVEHFETQRLHKSGERIDVALTISPVHNRFGIVIGASQIARDISERRRIEETQVHMAAIVESSDDAIISKDLDGIITSWNSGAKRIFGYEAEEIVGHSVMRLIPRELHAEEPMILARLRAGQRVEHYESKRRRKNGELIDVSLTISPIRNAAGKVVGASKIARDITERKRAEAALIEREKLAATGRMAAAIAHEVNNPLESIMNLSYLLAHESGLSEKASYYTELLLKEVERASEITRRTLSFYRNPSLPSEVDMSQLLDTILRGKRQRLGEKGIAVDTKVDGEGTVWGLPGELGQVFSNLLENAIDAVHEGGHIVMRMRDLKGKESVQISVCDNGSGMSPETQNRIFEPFFTTKNSRGSGLGLWVTRGIVDKYNGSIRIRTSQSGKRHGTIFTIILPRGVAIKAEEPAALSAD